jgi:hypothetical protein
MVYELRGSGNMLKQSVFLKTLNILIAVLLLSVPAVATTAPADDLKNIRTSIGANSRTDGGANGVGNGGDVIFCTASDNNFLNGAYSLDYILTLSEMQSDTSNAAVSSWKNSSDRIYKILAEKVPTLADLFNDYRRLVFNTGDYSLKRVWEPAPFGLVDLKDELITSQLPRNCQHDGQYQVVQAAIKQFNSFSGTKDKIIYKFVPALVNELDERSPLQLSYLLVHEWLWDISTNVDRNRRINRFLHSLKIATMSADEVKDYLLGMGLLIPDVKSKVFSPSSCQGNKLTASDIFNQKENIRILGKIVHFGRKHLILPAKPISERGWLEEDSMRDKFNDAKFFLYTMKNPNPAEKQLVHIYSPNWPSLSSWKISGQISCEFKEEDIYNLTCIVNDKLPVVLKRVRGIITDECLRLESEYDTQEEIEEIHSVMGLLSYRIQRVLFINYRWHN